MVFNGTFNSIIWQTTKWSVKVEAIYKQVDVNSRKMLEIHVRPLLSMYNQIECVHLFGKMLSFAREI